MIGKETDSNCQPQQPGRTTQSVRDGDFDMEMIMLLQTNGNRVCHIFSLLWLVPAALTFGCRSVLFTGAVD